ncbi:MAG: ferritin-like domain-containing protein [Acidimicrobiia bacterium]|nr:ferritin-like domain-containing protein [Acidimicrobiia bacterium]
MSNSKAFRVAAREVDEQHHEGMRDIDEQLHELHRGETGRLLAESRRSFVKKVGIGGALVSLGSTMVPVSSLMPAAWAQGDSEGEADLSDTDIAAFAQSVELAAVAAYEAAAGTGLLDATATEVGTLFASHHDDHAGAFASLAGDAAPNEPNATVLEAFAPMIQEAGDQAGLLTIAKQLEEHASSTYVFALGALTSQEAAAATATVLPIESQHAVVLGQFLELPPEDYLPPFETADEALDPAEYPVS